MRLFLVVLTLCIVSFGADAETSFYRGRLFQVESPSGAISHVFGTYHSADPEILALPAAVKRAFTKSTVVALEIKSSEAAESDFLAFSFLPEGRTITSLIGETYAEQLFEVLEPWELPSYIVDLMEPMALLAMLDYSQEDVRRLANDEQVLDDWLESTALLQGKTVVALESQDEQLRIFTGLPRWFMSMSLISALRLHHTFEDRSKQRTELYLSGELAELTDWMNEEFGEGFLGWMARQRLIVVRNHRMAERAEPLLNRGGAFIAVGVGHLGGDEGLLQLLLDRGYQVSRAD